MRVLVAGATGAMGTELVPRLVEAGHEVFAMVRSEHSKEARKREVQHRARVFFDAHVVHNAGYWSVVGSVGCLEHCVLPSRLRGAEGASEHEKRDGETDRRRDR